MSEEKTKVKCPKCEEIRTIKGTEERVRCSNSECKHRYYTKKNIFVPKPPKKKDKKEEKGTISGQLYTQDEINQIDKIERIRAMGTPIIDDTVKVLFDNLDKSITSVWGPRPNGKNKWDAKYTMWLAFKQWAVKQLIDG